MAAATNALAASLIEGDSSGRFTLDREENSFLPAWERVDERVGVLPGVSLARRWYGPGREMRPHFHSDATISFVIAGSVQESAEMASGAQRHQAGFGCAVVKPAGVVHSNRFGPGGAQLVSFEFDGAAADGRCSAAANIARELLTEASFYCWTDHHLVALTGLRLLGALSGPPGALAPALERILEDLQSQLRRLRTASSRPGHVPPWMKAAMLRLHDPARRPLRVRDLGLELGVHPVCLARGFRRVHGCAASEYRQRLQLVGAARRLAETSLPASRIAVESGFADQPHLCRAFRRHLGLTPGQFRSSVAPLN